MTSTPPDPTGSALPEAGPGSLSYLLGPGLLVMGGVGTLLGVLHYVAPALGQSLPMSATGAATVTTAGAVALALGWWLTRRTVRRVGRGHRRADGPDAVPTLVLQGAAVDDGRTALARVEEHDLVLEHMEPRWWAVVLGCIGWAAYVHFSVSGTFAGGFPWHVVLIVTVPTWNRKVVRRFPLDAFAALEERDRTLRLHRRGAGRPPLDIALKSWQVARCAEALRARHPDGLRGDPPPDTADAGAAHDETHAMRAAVATWVPEDRSPAATAIGAGLLLAGLLLGAFDRVRVLPYSGVLSWIAAIAGVLIWMQDGAKAAYTRREARRLGHDTVDALAVETRRERRDLIGWLAPWRRTEIEVAEGERLVLLHRSADGFEAAVMAGVACVASYVLIGSFRPWWAAACYVPLLASGYPRLRTDRDEIEAAHVVSLEDEGSRATLHVRDEDGERAIALRFTSGGGARFAALVRELCPGARIREPGWRHAS